MTASIATRVGLYRAESSLQPAWVFRWAVQSDGWTTRLGHCAVGCPFLQTPSWLLRLLFNDRVDSSLLPASVFRSMISTTAAAPHTVSSLTGNFASWLRFDYDAAAWYFRARVGWVGPGMTHSGGRWGWWTRWAVCFWTASLGTLQLRNSTVLFSAAGVCVRVWTLRLSAAAELASGYLFGESEDLFFLSAHHRYNLNLHLSKLHNYSDPI